MASEIEDNLLVRAGRLINRVAYRFVRIFSHARLIPALREAVAELEREQLPQKVMSVGAGGRLGAVPRGLKNGTVVEADIDPERAPDLVADICNMGEVADGSFDAIFVMEVLEHVQEPDRAMSELYRVLRPGGRLLISVPFLFEIHEAPHDYFRYTRFGLAHLCSSFEDVEIECRNGYVFAVLLPGMRLIMSQYWTDKILAWVFCLMVFLLWPLLAVLDRLVRSEAVTTGYIVRARKSSE